MTTVRSVVWLLREPDDPDPYEQELAGAGYDPHFVPVLSFERVNERLLRKAMEHPNNYSGLIFTSPRAVDAVAEALPWLPSENLAWHARSIFAVGPRTAAELRGIGFTPEGEESGSARMLSDYILAKDFPRPLLFLCGERRSDELPDRLRSKGVEVEEICVYRTFPKSDLDTKGLPQADWFVFFSPSGLEAVLESGSSELSGSRFAAIGETTADALRTAGFRVDATADEPTPSGVLSAIRAAGG